MDKLTLKGVKVALAELGISVNKREGEYKVNFKGGAEPTAYYTSDLNDALRTGRCMADERDRGAVQPFGISSELRELLDAAIRLRVLSSSDLLGMGSVWRGERAAAEWVMQCAFAQRHSVHMRDAHAELCKLNDAHAALSRYPGE